MYFADALPHLTWQASDRNENLPATKAWLDDAGLPNTPIPLELDVKEAWPNQRFDAVFTANTLSGDVEQFHAVRVEYWALKKAA